MRTRSHGLKENVGQICSDLLVLSLARAKSNMLKIDVTVNTTSCYSKLCPVF